MPTPKDISRSLITQMLSDLEGAWDCAIEPYIVELISAQLHGILRRMYITDDGWLSNRGLEKTHQSNLRTQAVAARKKETLTQRRNA